MSLADQLESRHRESGGSGSVNQQAPVTAREAPVQAPSKSSGNVSAQDHSNGSTNGHSRAPKVVLQNLPQLKTATPGLKTPTSPLPAWPAAQAAAPAVRSGPRVSTSSSAVTSTLSVETQVPKSILLEGVVATSSATGVQIEITKSAVGHTTFMLKGKPQAVEKAKPLLQAQLAPRVKTTLRIPTAGRSALIGARGSNLRRVSEQTHCKIDLNASPSPWSLDLTEVHIEGTADGIEAARAEVLSVVDKARTVSAFRPIPALVVRFLSSHPEFGPNVAPQRGRITLQGTYDEIVPSMDAIDKLIDAWTIEYVTRPLSVGPGSELASYTVPENLLFEQHGVIITPEGALYGPPDKLDAAASEVEKFLATLSQTKLDIAQAHNRNEPHARVLTRYLAATQAVPQIAAQYSVKITEPAPGECVYNIIGEEKAASQARKALVAIVNSHGPTSMAVIRGMRIPVVRARAAKVTRGLTGNVKSIIGPSDELYIVFEDPGDDFAPTTEEIKTAVSNAVGAFDEVVQLARKSVSKTLNLDEDAKYISNPQGAAAKALFSQVISSRDDVHCDVTGSSAVISGLREPVNTAVASVPEIIALSKQHAVLASYTQEVQFDPTLLRNLIGRGGSQIQSYRDEYGVNVEADSNGRVVVQGVEEQAKAAAKAISELQRRLRDEHTERLVIPVQYHVKLIGPKGKHVKRLSEKYDVLIKFPKRGTVATASDDTSDSTRADTPEPDADVVVIRGPSKGVAAVKREFTDLVAYEKSQSYSRTLNVTAKLMPHIVGRQGVAINVIKHETSTQIDIAKEPDENGDVSIVITGEQKRVDEAVKLISKAVEDLQDHTERSIDIDQRYHRLLTGPGNSTRRQIIAEAGGETDPLNPRMLNIPPSHLNSPTIKMSGPKKVVDAMEAIILRIVQEEQRQSQASATVAIPQSQHRILIGPQGRIKRAAEQKYKVQITIPRGREQESDIVLVRGEQQENVDAAIEHLKELANVQQATLSVPSPIWTPRLKQKIGEKFGVKGEGRYFTANVEKSDSNFITATLDDAPKLQLKLTSQNQENLDKAIAFLTEISREADSIGYLWLDAKQVRKAVGSGGQNVNSVRSSTNCIVDIPDNSQTAPIVIVGPKNRVDEAHNALLKFCA